MKFTYKSLVVIGLSVGLTFSCADKLDILPQQSIDSELALSTPENIELTLVGAYALIGSGFSTDAPNDFGALYGTNLIMLPELAASEDYVFWQGTFNQYRDVARKNMLADNTTAWLTWRRAYKAINAVNGVLSAITIVPESDRNKIQGEALFIRGLMYFELVRFYALPWETGASNTQPGVPLLLTPTKQIDGSARLPRSTVTEVYTQILQDMTTAKALLPEENGVRANTYVASAFLSRVYLQQSDFTNARDEAHRVIESGMYELTNSVTDVFMEDGTEEAIFEIQQNEQNNAGQTNDGLATFFASLEGIGRADVLVEEAFYNLYSNDDLRKQQLFYEGIGRRPGLRTSKWTDPFKNIPVIRLAEMYLTRAEANLRLVTAIGATPADDINTIRTRAGLPAVGTVTLEDILLERQLELAFEGVRIHDIKRTKGSTGNFAYNSPRLVFPIPQREINANPNLEQNSGY